MRFGYEAFRFQRHGGVTRYFAELHRGLLGRGVDSAVDAGLHINEHLRGLERVRGLDVSRWPGGRARQALTKGLDPLFWVPVRELAAPTSVYHGTWYTPVVPRRPTVVTTVFDLTAERFPAQVHQARHTSASKRRWCERAAVVMAISEHTRDDLVERFGVSPDKVVVTHLGVDAVTPGPTHPLQGGPPYLLYVGDRRSPYKNVKNLMWALHAAGLPADVRLVFVGAPRDADDERLLRATGWAGRTDVISADDVTLAALYRDALALVYPSRYEGFGLPPLEAMTQGCPVVATTGGAVPEVVGDAAVLVDPGDVDGWAAGLHRVVDDEVYRASLIAAGRARAATFTWERTVEQTLAAYRALG